MIEFKNVDKVYPGGFKALKDINLTIADGEFVAIIGRSGSGKSTLIRTINKMHDINSGTLTVDGVDVKSLKGKELRKFRRNIGMIFQSFNLVERISVIKNVMSSFVPDLNLFQSIFGVYPKECKIKALEALEQVDILDKAFERADNLSGGQQQRVALARTLVQNPSIILADEPVASLDPVTARQVMDYFKKINENLGITILLNIHHVELALEYATKVLGVRDGEIIYYGPSKDVDDKVLKSIYGDSFEEIKMEEIWTSTTKFLNQKNI